MAGMWLQPEGQGEACRLEQSLTEGCFQVAAEGEQNMGFLVR